MLRNATESKGIYVCGEVRKGKIHSVTMELIGKARELADKKNTLTYESHQEKIIFLLFVSILMS